MSQNKWQTTNTTTTQNNKPNSESEILHMAPYLAYINLAISGIGSTCRAYANRDTPMLALVALVLLSYLLLDLCFRALRRLPPGSERDAERVALKSAVWWLSTAILFCFAYQITISCGLTATLFVFIVVVGACIFFVYFVDDHKVHGRTDFYYSGYEKILIEDMRVELVFEKV